jgi:multidrug resistance protein MdtO
MATVASQAQPVSSQASSSAWKLQFLRDELAPYPGRVSLVTRMLIAATLSMLITMTFRIPEGAYAAIYAFNISRVSPKATIAAAKTVAIVFVIAAAYELVGAVLFVSEPVLRVLWLLPTFVLMFYLLSAMTNYTAAMRFGYLVIITTPIWDRHISANARIESTLWAVLALTLSTGIATLIELIYAEFSRGNELTEPIAMNGLVKVFGSSKVTSSSRCPKSRRWKRSVSLRDSV